MWHFVVLTSENGKSLKCEYFSLVVLSENIKIRPVHSNRHGNSPTAGKHLLVINCWDVTPPSPSTPSKPRPLPPVRLLGWPGRAWWAEPSGRSRYPKNRPPRTSTSPWPRGRPATASPPFPSAAMATDNNNSSKTFHDAGSGEQLDGEQLQPRPSCAFLPPTWNQKQMSRNDGGLDPARSERHDRGSGSEGPLRNKFLRK